MRLTPRLRVPLVLGAAAALACGTDVPFVPEPPAFCESAVTMQVAGGTTPTISWSPACRVTRLTVVQGTDTVWYIRALDGLDPGLRYGTAPYGSQIFVDAKPLAAGASYDFTAWLIRNDTARVYGTASYKP